MLIPYHDDMMLIVWWYHEDMTREREMQCDYTMSCIISCTIKFQSFVSSHLFLNIGNSGSVWLAASGQNDIINWWSVSSWGHCASEGRWGPWPLAPSPRTPGGPWGTEPFRRPFAFQTNSDFMDLDLFKFAKNIIFAKIHKKINNPGLSPACGSNSQCFSNAHGR